MRLCICHKCGREFQAVTYRARFCPGKCFAAHENECNRQRASRYSPERRRAAIVTASALNKRTLIRQPCEVCGARNVVAHHDDYARPLDVRWLCRSHHRLHHVAHGPGANA